MKIKQLLSILIKLSVFASVYYIMGICWDIKEGDSSIYLVYLKNFFDLPFSFQRGTVAHGASSPLHVILNAPLYNLFNDYWLIALKFFNFTLIALSIIILNRSIRGNSITLLIILIFTILSFDLFYYTSEIFETGLAFFTISLLYFYLQNKRWYISIIISGILHLVRPELILVSITAYFYILYQLLKNKDYTIKHSYKKYIGFLLFENYIKRIIVISIIAYMPLIIYYVYMYIFTGTIIPSSVYGRFLFHVSESSFFDDGVHTGLNSPWMEKIWTAYDEFTWKSRKYLWSYIGGTSLLVFLIALIRRKIEFVKHELILFLPLFLLYSAYPSNYQLVRYLLPISPIIIIVVVKCIYIVKINTNYHFLISAFLMLIVIYLTDYSKNWPGIQKRFDYDIVLQKSSAKVFNRLLKPNDKVIIQEIQSQFYSNVYCVSSDGIVGNEMRDYLSGKISLEETIKREKITYITSKTNYREFEVNDPIYKSLLPFGKNGKINDVIIIGKLRFTIVHKKNDSSLPWFTLFRIDYL